MTQSVSSECRGLLWDLSCKRIGHQILGVRNKPAYFYGDQIDLLNFPQKLRLLKGKKGKY